MSSGGAATSRDDHGFTLVEILVALGIFSLLGSLLLGFAVATSRVTNGVDDAANVTGESRLALERMARELRQAREVDAVQFQSSTTTTTAITFWTDFNGNGLRDLSAADPEVLTYRWDPSSKELTLTANDADGSSLTRPVLAGTVLDFSLGLQSSLWAYDTSPTNTTSTTWAELDAAGAPVGNKNGRPDGPELDHIDLISLTMRVREGDAEQTFTTQIDLRNMAQS